VGVGGTVNGIPALDDDAPGVVNVELGALDEVREVGLEERKSPRGAAARTSGARRTSSSPSRSRRATASESYGEPAR